MSDIALKQVDDEFDIDFNEIDAIHDDGLETAVVISVFSDGRCTDKELPFGHKTKRGYWADVFQNGITTGSKLWLKTRAKTLNETLENLKQAIKESLVWMINEGIAADIITDGQIVDRERIDLSISIIKPDGNESSFDFLWSNEGIRYGLQ